MHPSLEPGTDVAADVMLNAKHADRDGSHPVEPEPQVMSSPRLYSQANRFILPTICAVLAVLSSLFGEVVLVEHAGAPTMGPLVAAQIVVLISIAFVALCIITLLLAIFPGRDPEPGDYDDDLDDHYVDYDDGVDGPDDYDDVTVVDPAAGQAEVAAADRDAEPDTDQNDEPPARRGRSSEDIIAALKKSATKQANARIAAEKRAEAADARATDLEERMEAFRTGTAPEMKALDAQYREEANRDAMGKVHELGEASERLAQALKDARARAEEELREVRTQAEADRTRAQEDLSAAQSQAEQDLATKDDELRQVHESVPVLRRAAAADEYRRIEIALAAINNSPDEHLDAMQRNAVQHHADRITAAIARLNPDATTSFGPDMAMPLLAFRPTETPAAEVPVAKKKRVPGFRRTRKHVD